MLLGLISSIRSGGITRYEHILGHFKYNPYGRSAMKTNFFLIIAKSTILVILLVFAAAAHGLEVPVAWVSVYEEDFSDDSWHEAWKLDGSAELSTGKDADTSFLRIKTLSSEVNTRDKYSTLWLRKRLRGDLLVKFRARADAGNRALLYFRSGR